MGIAAGPHGGKIEVSTPEGNLGAWMNVAGWGGNVITRDAEGSITGKLP